MIDSDDARLVQAPPEVLAPFNAAGILGPGDIHAAEAICRLAGEDDPSVLLAVALAVRAPRYGHTCVDLTSAPASVIADDEAVEEEGPLPWPDPDAWRAAVAASPAVAVAPVSGTAVAPLRLEGDLLYLDRFLRYEQRLAERILELNAASVDEGPPVADDDPLLGDRPEQLEAIRTALRRPFSVIVGGPGTGKTFTIARLMAVALSAAAAAGVPAPRVALVAPTGKAAARLTEQLHDCAERLPVSTDVAAALTDLAATTIHRLLGRSRDSDTRFRHSADNPVEADLVIVDESSMVSLSLMAKLVDAVPAGSRLILVGDPDQLESVEAGSVLSDLMGPFADAVLGDPPAAAEVAGHPLAESISIMREGHRFRADKPIAQLAQAVHRGDVEGALQVLTADVVDEETGEAVMLIEPDDPTGWPTPTGALAEVFERVGHAARAAVVAAEAGDAEAALAAVRRTQVLCAVRRGPAGVYAWNRAIERWLGIPPWGPEPYAGRPLLATSNDYRLGVFNGDLGVLVQSDGRLRAAFDTATGIRLLDPQRLDGLETVHAMTIHKSQGSQFRDVVIVLPEDSARVTRNLLYTAITRASGSVAVIATEDVLWAVVHRRLDRVSGLTDRLLDPLGSRQAKREYEGSSRGGKQET
jgi:exodeoxyribonuclease V alpha subunit